MECQTKNNLSHATNSQKCDYDIQALEKILLDISKITIETQRLAKQTMLNRELVNEHNNGVFLAMEETVKQLMEKSAVIWHDCKQAVRKIQLEIQAYTTLVEPLNLNENETTNPALKQGITITLIYEMLQEAHREIKELFLAVQNITIKTNILLQVTELSQRVAKHNSRKRELIGAEGLSLKD
ncbi:hypothetical protein [Brevibacillus laterosporus]|uniref:Uncharacterized protein n=1 Tax=Brevibacillus laterosporus TaxID=1465 RepID=A0AAP3DC74_BRELA|nr:hypothetical protein [Brevibacillus laterosporus]MCR8978534.1 hypothetical protein [Brevibacillus laterosporus]MCZ0805689.1 hypothetical protein [Brevibacillus laterosporus]MCZ0824544.1 hypothetical protein [Brevibacillus laterosporus]MCZ0848448.1 hypothetical protein [Brevibacillus laterosporus]